MKIREAAPRDIPQIMRLYRQIIARLYELAPLYRTNEEQDESFIKDTITSDKSDILIAEEEGAALGFALLQSRESAKLAGVAQRRYAFLMDICVDEKLRGRGVGSALLAACEEWARGRGLEYMELNVLEANAAARRLYERAGYAKTVSVMRRELEANGGGKSGR
ncbi:GNAT family N-acetyltransferase [Cloacibacillus sp. An23]|uniref:GNAT family N-acetyltransferase n=1 Tax=Cloacibacillus sp. An23 TaxID=1965591 RepID=UPI000B3916FE|nr:GNAT family N-acetyltransferase [Cloacibacillus sp. An23]OUO93858.1 hypothetical protein B5F39_06665 [Cloacibacillus sp. An23]